MKKISKKEQLRLYAEQWKQTGPELDRIHCEELRAYEYNPRDADALLQLGDSFNGPPRLTSGMDEMQRWFMKLAQKQGLLPLVAKEDEAPYEAK